MTDESAPQQTILRISDLSERRPNRFELQADAGLSAAIAEDLGLQGLKRLRLSGRIERQSRESWKLVAELGATATQSCVVTLAPVVTRIDTPVLRRYCPMAAPPDEPESELTEDDIVEPLTAEIDLVALIRESLSLSLPDYPRAEDAALSESRFAAPGITPLSDAEVHPFAALSKLRKDPDSE